MNKRVKRNLVKVTLLVALLVGFVGFKLHNSDRVNALEEPKVVAEDDRINAPKIDDDMSYDMPEDESATEIVDDSHYDQYNYSDWTDKVVVNENINETKKPEKSIQDSVVYVKDGKEVSEEEINKGKGKELTNEEKEELKPEVKPETKKEIEEKKQKKEEKVAEIADAEEKAMEEARKEVSEKTEEQTTPVIDLTDIPEEDIITNETKEEDKFVDVSFDLFDVFGIENEETAPAEEVAEEVATDANGTEVVAATEEAEAEVAEEAEVEEPKVVERDGYTYVYSSEYTEVVYDAASMTVYFPLSYFNPDMI